MATMARKIPPHMSANQAARILFMDPKTVKQMIRTGIWDFGEVIPGRKAGKKNDRIIIWTAKLAKHIGREITEDEIEETAQ